MVISSKLGFVVFFNCLPEESLVDVLEIPTATGDLMKIVSKRVQINVFAQVWLSFQHIAQVRLGFVAVGEGRSDGNHLLSA